METWFDYRVAWSRSPWLLTYFIIVVAVLLLALFATFVLRSGPLMILFIPSLISLYLHHHMAMKRRNESPAAGK